MDLVEYAVNAEANYFINRDAIAYVHVAISRNGLGRQVTIHFTGNAPAIIFGCTDHEAAQKMVRKLFPE